ncbi:acyl-CoA desaturase [Brumicola pallidula]|uniref:Fatty acid desaturase n=1 Tax=Brumicola pallidula DSM 14239 = ACAM 615 TaxID=1121922 RepID=K6YV88_9ALTE|nr:acyl-CoA desaturase [Glaciecola pallidula]GAC27881.1 fatty acid desaturase [Glaciecola pallidula DSM 14239 = ACAM 615]
MYTNDRIVIDELSNANAGVVVFSISKVLWVGSMFLAAMIGGYYTFSMASFLVFVITTIVSLCLGHSLGMHRRLIHKSYQCPLWLEYLFVHLGVIVGLAGPIGMIKTHDMRDWAQRQENCHDYFGHQQPIWKDFLWQIFCDIKLENSPKFNIEQSVCNDRVYRWMEKSWMLQQLPLAIILFWFGGLAWVVWGIAVRVSVSVTGHWLIGYFAHNHGKRDWHVDRAHVQGYNVPFAALLTMGESYHNNHHAFPASANMGLEKGQVDVGWLVLKGLAYIGLTWDLTLPEQLPAREELKRIMPTSKTL